MNIPACISGAADWVLEPQRQRRAPAGGDHRRPHHQHAARSQARRARPVALRPREATPSRKVAGISARSAGREDQAREQDQRGAGEASSRSNQPCSMSRARLTPVAAPVKAGALQHADGDDEAQVALGVEPGQLGEVAEDAREAEEEDRRRQHAGDRRAGHAEDLVRGAADQRATVARFARSAHPRRSAARPRIASALSASRPSAPIRAAEAIAQLVAAVEAGDDRLAHAPRR